MGENVHSKNLQVGDQYSKLRKTISIIILDDELPLTKDIKKPQTIWKIREDENSDILLTKYFEIGIIEIPKAIKEYEKNPRDEVLQWMMFLDNPEKKEVTKIMEENEDIKEAKEELEKISQDDILRRKALNRQLEIADRLQFAKEAREKGKKEGEEIKARKIIKKLHDMNMPLDQIAKIVELEEKEVEKYLN